MNTYGLIGKDISYSFSKEYFSKKFQLEAIDAVYQNFDIPDLTEVREIWKKSIHIKGLNVTIPYKEKIIPFLDSIDAQAAEIGAVNTIAFQYGKTKGFNTDCFGFMKSLFPFLEKQHTQALILGTGGASKAVAHALSSMGIEYKIVSRQKNECYLSYEELDERIINQYYLIINCTPLGTSPNTKASPTIPYSLLTPKHFLYDLVYNPPLTQFLANGKLKGCKILNGKKMLEYQAEKAWEIWNNC